MIAISTQIPVIGEIVNPTITAGIPPIYGPKYGMMSVNAQNNANTIGASSPANVKPIVCVINTINIIIKTPCT